MSDEPTDTDVPDVEQTVSITVEDGLWIAEDEETGLSSQGKAKSEALRNLAETLDTVEEGEDEGGDDWL